MIKKAFQFVLFQGFLWLFTVPVFSAEVIWKDYFVFYGDNTEFYEPYRLRETILGQYGKSWFEAATTSATDFSTWSSSASCSSRSSMA